MTTVTPRTTVPTNTHVREQVDALTKQRSDLLETKPTIHGSTGWTMAGGFAGMVVGSAAAVPVSNLVDRISPPKHKWDIGRSMAAGVGVALVAAAGAGGLTWNITKPDGAARDALVSAHEATVKSKVDVIDRQLRALTG